MVEQHDPLRAEATVGRNNRLLAMTGGLALAVGLAACGGSGVNGPTTGTATTGTDVPSATGQAGTPTDPGSTASSSGVRFTLAEGTQRDMCGIRVRVVFIPPSATESGGYQPFLVGGPAGGADPTAGDQPLPGNAAPARAGETATVLGKRFLIGAVDVANRRVELVAIC
jgi:hypothetical protein